MIKINIKSKINKKENKNDYYLQWDNIYWWKTILDYEILISKKLKEYNKKEGGTNKK